MRVISQENCYARTRTLTRSNRAFLAGGPEVGRHHLSSTQWLVIGALAFYGLAKLGILLFSMQPDGIPLLWLPSGIALAMVRFAGWRALPYIFIASFAAQYPLMAHMSITLPMLHTSVAAGADVVEAYLALLLMRRFMPQGLVQLRDLLTLIGLVALPATLLNALILSTSLWLGQYFTWANALLLGGLVTFSNTLGILLITPLISAWLSQNATTRASLLRWAGLTLLTIGVTWLSFLYVAAAIYLVVPALLYQVFAGRSGGVYLTLTLTLCLITGLSARSLGPFQVTNDIEAHLMLVSYLISTAVLVIGVNLQHRNLEQEIEEKRTWQFRANHDPLTGLGNRLLFMPLLEQEIRRARRARRGFSLAIVDIDHFKNINDFYGHSTGDRALVKVSGQIAGALRDADTVARIGGEEFAILFPETALEDGVQAMERIQKAVSQTHLSESEQIMITISGGLIECRPGYLTTVDSVLQAADQLLYQAKHGGRNRILTGKLQPDESSHAPLH